MSALGTFEHGGVVPTTGINLVHAGERVLTERQNQNIERLADGGGGGPVYNLYHAAPGESPDSVLAVTPSNSSDGCATARMRLSLASIGEESDRSRTLSITGRNRERRNESPPAGRRVR